MRFGLFGTGYWAEYTHGAALLAHPDAELVGVWGRRADQAERLAAELRCAPYRDPDSLIVDVEAVAIALPPAVQATLAARAARTGRHLLLDKPVALTAADASAIADAVTAAGVASVVFFTSRFDPVRERALMELATSTEWWSADITIVGSIFEPDSPYRESRWRREHGGLWDLGPHALARVLPVLGPVREVSAVPGPYDTTYALLRHGEPTRTDLGAVGWPEQTATPASSRAGLAASGPVSRLMLSLAVPPRSAHQESRLIGPDGAVDLPGHGVEPVAAYHTAIDALLEQVRTDRPGHPCDVHLGRVVTEVLAAIETARQTGRRVGL